MKEKLTTCDSCGAEIATSAKTCPQCGAKRKRPITKKWWFWVIVVIAVLTLFSSLSGKKKDNERIVWREMELRDLLPDPPASKGKLYTNSEGELDFYVVKVSDKKYDQYVAACADSGFTVDAEKNNSSYSAYNADGYSLHLSHSEDKLHVTLKAPMEFSDIVWPTSALGKQVPTPRSMQGKFSYEKDSQFSLYVGDTSKADYEQYISDCVAAGFTVDYSKDDTSYQAKNANGDKIFLAYEGNGIMRIEAKASDEKNTVDPSQEASDPSASNPGAEENTSSGIRSDFKAAMDSYEAFIDEYVAFLKKYNDNPSDLSLIADYAKYVSKYADMVNQFDKWESEDLSDEELAYYVDVQARVSKKILSVT